MGRFHIFYQKSSKIRVTEQSSMLINSDGWMEKRPSVDQYVTGGVMSGQSKRREKYRVIDFLSNEM